MKKFVLLALLLWTSHSLIRAQNAIIELDVETGNDRAVQEIYTNSSSSESNGLAIISNDTGEEAGTDIYSQAFLAGFQTRSFLSSGAGRNIGVWGHSTAIGQDGYGLVASQGSSLDSPERYALFCNDTYAGILMGGNVGIGTRTPTVPLYVKGNSDITATANGQFAVEGPNGWTMFFDGNEIQSRDVDNGDPINIGLQTEGGLVGIGVVSNLEEKLQVNGNVLVSETVYVGDNTIGSGASLSKGNTAVGFGDPFEASEGILLEGGVSAGETGGFYAGGNFAVIWSPGDGNRLLRVYDEDATLATAERWYVDAGGMDMTASDRRLKKDIKTLDRALDKVQQLRGVSYVWKKNAEELAKGDRETKTIGVIAQELESVYPELVQTSEHGRKFVNYKGLTPILIEAVKEQQTQIEERDDKIAELEARLDKLENTLQQIVLNGTAITPGGTSQNLELNAPARLEQNQPNPFGEDTTVRYFLPEATQNAQLRITDQNGQVISTLRLEGNGNGQVNIKSGTLSSGSYFYSLIVDGEIVETRQMVLSK